MNIIRGLYRASLFLVIAFACGISNAQRVHAADAHEACQASQHGVNPDARDNTAAFKKMLTECAGKEIRIPRGTYTFSPAGYDNGLYIQSDTSIVGDGAEGDSGTVMRIADTGNFASLFWIRDASNVSIHGIKFEGTSYESGCTKHLDYGHAITIHSSAGARAPVETIKITANQFHNFNGQSWITITAQDHSPGVGAHSEIAISNNAFVSDANLHGSCAATGGIGYPVFMVWLHGSDESGEGMIENVSISSNTFQADYVKGAVVVWSDTAHIDIQNNTINNAGLRLPAAPQTELGRYAITIYNSAHEKPGHWPDTITVVGNTIVNPVSAGVYVAGARNLEISRNRISGQSDRYDGTLPKGAIALNHAQNVRAVEGNELVNNYFGITLVATDAPVKDNHVTPAPGGMRTKIWRDEHSAPEIQR